jgi:hypothetical protein
VALMRDRIKASLTLSGELNAVKHANFARTDPGLEALLPNKVVGA